jgi:hypothetical protein
VADGTENVTTISALICPEVFGREDKLSSHDAPGARPPEHSVVNAVNPEVDEIDVLNGFAVVLESSLNRHPPKVKV